MPTYEYYCPDNGRVVDVVHSIKQDLKTWGQVCHFAGLDKGETPGYALVHRRIVAPNIHVPQSDSALKEQGFSKLVRRDHGVYENVTATNDAERIVDLHQRPPMSP